MGSLSQAVTAGRSRKKKRRAHFLSHLFGGMYGVPLGVTNILIGCSAGQRTCAFKPIINPTWFCERMPRRGLTLEK